MTAMPPLRDILNNTPADAINVDFNFNTIESHIGSELINRDGSVAMTGPLSLSGPPTAVQHAATKAYVDSNVIPIGTVWMFAGPTVPGGWVFCDGSSKSTTDPLYAALFAAVGYAYGGSGANFNLPNLQGRFPVGRSITAPIDPTFDTLNDQGGSKDIALIAHTHDMKNHTHADSIVAESAHSHTTNFGNVPVSGGYGVQGEPSGWPGPGNPSGILFGDPPVSTGMGSRSPAGWFSKSLACYLGSPATATNTGHTHGLNLAGPNDNTTSQAGTAPNGTGANLPPFITINFIIRIG
jgi:microcystin-dependent protein